MKWSLLRRIESYLRRSGMRATTFGREAAGDPMLVSQLRKGRVARRPMAAKIEAYLQRAQLELAEKSSRRRR